MSDTFFVHSAICPPPPLLPGSLHSFLTKREKEKKEKKISQKKGASGCH